MKGTYGLFDRPQRVIRIKYGFKKLTEVFACVEFIFNEISALKIKYNIEKERFYENFDVFVDFFTIYNYYYYLIFCIYKDIFNSYRLQQKWYLKIYHDSEKSLLCDRWSKNRKTILAPLVVIVEL